MYVWGIFLSSNFLFEDFLYQILLYVSEVFLFEGFLYELFRTHFLFLFLDSENFRFFRRNNEYDLIMVFLTQICSPSRVIVHGISSREIWNFEKKSPKITSKFVWFLISIEFFTMLRRRISAWSIYFWWSFLKAWMRLYIYWAGIPVSREKTFFLQKYKINWKIFISIKFFTVLGWTILVRAIFILCSFL